ncbi:MAG: GHKL domain-containing protein [Lachnospiraceae bacterium]|nr:GHKL domain-containing protein [Lachnospiraceae bacterium]
MITNICLLLEALSILYCVNCLYGEKFRLDFATTSYLAIYMIIMVAINYYHLPQLYTLIVYPIFGIYCGIKFGFKIMKIIINLVLCVMIVGGTQILIMLFAGYVFHIQHYDNILLLVVNSIVFLIVIVLTPRNKVEKISEYLHDKGRILKIAIIMCTSLTIFWLLSYKEYETVELNQAILLFVSIAFILILAAQLGTYKIKTKEIETELKMHKLYADSFQGLIENIRLRQHEFDNHINTIYSQHYIYDTYEELVKAQEDYCNIVIKDNRFNKLLNTSNPIIIGFLYGKFLEIDKKGIEISYNVKIKELDIDVPVYKVIEILGNLINNAVEAIENTEGTDKLYVSIVEDDKFEIEVCNESPYISYDEISKFFLKGFSRKGKNRGLGLYSVIRICSEYKLNISCENIEIDNRNWIQFKVIKEKKPLN